jgi:hypothetical protein
MANKIALVDASPADETEFRNLLAQAASRLPQRWEASAIGEADLVIVDVDSVFGHMTWLKVLNLGKVAGVYTEHAPPKETDLVLRKPLSVAGIVELISHFHGHAPTTHAAVQAATPAPPPERPAPMPAQVMRPTPPPPARPTPVVAPPAPTPSPTPAPAAVALPQAPSPGMPTPSPPHAPPRDTTLIDFLAGSQLSGPARLSTEGAPDLILDPKTQVYHAAGTGLRALAPHCTRKLKPEDFHPITGADLDRARASAPAQPYSRLLWFCIVNASGGQLLPELDNNARYKLNRWPQIEREFAKHFRIATVMMKQLSTLAEIAEGSGASLVDVTDFVNAYHAIGSVDNDMAKPGDAAADAGKGGMLSRLRNPFGRQ